MDSEKEKKQSRKRKESGRESKCKKFKGGSKGRVRKGVSFKNSKERETRRGNLT